jgi:ATP-dependent Lon protease
MSRVRAGPAAVEALLAIREEPLLPGELRVLHPTWVEAQKAIRKANRQGRQLVILPEAEFQPSMGIATLVRILSVASRPKNFVIVQVQGVRRVRVTAIQSVRPYTVVSISRPSEPRNLDAGGVRRLQRLVYKAKDDDPFFDSGQVGDDASMRIDRLGLQMRIGGSAKLAFLGAQSLNARLRILEKILGKKEEGRTSRRRRLAATENDEEEEFTQQLPPEVRAAIQREKKTEYDSFSGRSRVALGFLRELKWEAPARQPMNLRRARELLDGSHAGLEEVKEAVLDYLSDLEWGRRKGLPIASTGGTSLCLIGPPGTGKTSIASTIAEVTGRKLERIPMGGVDDLFLVGADRTWTGSRPGEILRRLRNSGKHPSEVVFLLDEVDKMNRHFAKDPLPVLLALLDPTQNHAFQDQFLDGVRIDLSAALFIATANSEQAIPEPLKDRMKVIHLPRYAREEQLAIGREYILPRLLRRFSVTDEVEVSAEALYSLVFDYPRSDGLRQLQVRLQTVISRGLRLHLETQRSVMVRPDLVRDWLPAQTAGRTIGFRASGGAMQQVVPAPPEGPDPSLALRGRALGSELHGARGGLGRLCSDCEYQPRPRGRQGSTHQVGQGRSPSPSCARSCRLWVPRPRSSGRTRRGIPPLDATEHPQDVTTAMP